jgi:predicted nucleic acid-binding protein
LGVYLDTSAIAKLYHPEIGAAVVEQVVNSSRNDCFIARLGLLEMHSVVTQKVRAGELSLSDATLVLRGFRRDIRSRRFRVIALRVRHYEMAERFLDTYGPTHGLRTLDALHLALAVDLKNARFVTSIIAADKVLCRVAPYEGLAVIDPEATTPTP